MIFLSSHNLFQQNIEGPPSMSLLFIYKSCRKVNTKLAIGANWYLMVSVESGQASAHTLPEGGQTF